MDMGSCYLDGNADAVEFCPQHPFHNLIAASTYTLKEGDHPTRSGSISIFNIDPENCLQLQHRITTSGVFDIKWRPIGEEPPILAQAGSDGYLKLYTLDGQSMPSNAKLGDIYGKEISSSMCLSVDWSPLAASISTGLSDGSISISSISESRIETELEWKAHEFELWATCFDTHFPLLVYSGGDDCKFSCWDLRCNPLNPVFQNLKIHKMGVCCIAKCPFDPYIVLTGSYDECLRMWDVRSISSPVNRISIGLGGGVWRIKHHPNVRGLILAACMHNGFSVVDINGEMPRVVEQYKKHGSLAYGADWMRGEGRGKSAVVATCSFYDRLLCVWMMKNDIHP